MHPILYPPGEKDFLDNGLAVLTDCTKCLVTEERNGAYTLEMQYPANGRHYDLIAEDCILLAKPNPDDKPQPFRLYKSGLTMSGVTTWYGEHVSYFANDVPIEPIAPSQTTPAGAFAKISAAAALENPFTFSTTLSTETSFGLATPTPLKKVLGGVEGSVLDQFGGEYHYNKWKIELLKNRGADRGFVISYGKNLTDISQEKNLTKVTTAIFPFWKSSDDDTLVTLPEKIVLLDGAREYGHVHCKTIDFSQDFTDAPSVDTLRAYAKAYLKTSGIAEPVVSITLKYMSIATTLRPPPPRKPPATLSPQSSRTKSSTPSLTTWSTAHTTAGQRGTSTTTRQTPQTIRPSSPPRSRPSRRRAITGRFIARATSISTTSSGPSCPPMTCGRPPILLRTQPPSSMVFGSTRARAAFPALPGMSISTSHIRTTRRSSRPRASTALRPASPQPTPPPRSRPSRPGP